jgi:hypothetical protein
LAPKGAGLLKVKIVLAPKGVIQNFIKNIRYDTGNPYLKGRISTVDLLLLTVLD